MSAELPFPMQMMQMVMGAWVAQAVSAAAHLALADHLAAGPLDASALAEKSGASADGVHRLMRALSSIGVFKMEGATFSLTPLGETLRSGVPGSMRNIVLAETDTAHWLSWGKFPQAIKEGRKMTIEALGTEPWDYYAKHPADGEQFSRAMGDISGLAIEPVLATYDFGYAGTIVDVGGAHGALLAAMLAKKPDAKGILFDLPNTVATAKGAIAAKGLSDRVEIVGGDFFKEVPKGGDLYLLKHILHDWDDAECVAILKCVRAAMKPTSKVVVVEFALADQAPPPAHFMDLNMLVMLSGRERTAEQYGALFAKAGLKMDRFLPTPSPIGICEASAG
jgi:hypothetical protein